MGLTRENIKFDSVDEAVESLTNSGYKVHEIDKTGLIYAVTPRNVSENHPRVNGTDQPMCVAVLFRGTDLAYRNGNHLEIEKHHSRLTQIYSNLTQ